MALARRDDNRIHCLLLQGFCSDAACGAVLPHIPGQKRKRGRPSKQDIAEREAHLAALQAEEAHAAEEAAAARTAKQRQAGVAVNAIAVPVPTADLDPPAQHSTSTSPVGGKAGSKQAGTAGVGSAAAKASKPGPASPKGRALSPKGRAQQKAAAAAAPSPASPSHDPQDSQKQQRCDNSVPLGEVLRSEGSTVKDLAQAAPKAAVGKPLKRLKKQAPATKHGKQLAAQHARQEFELGDDAPVPPQTAKAHAQPRPQDSADSQDAPASEAANKQQTEPAEPKHVEVLVTADAVDVDIEDMGCARARPWTKHLRPQLDTEADEQDAEQAMEHSEPAADVAPTAEAMADPPALTAVAKPAAAAATVQDELEQTGSGGVAARVTADRDQPDQGEAVTNSHRVGQAEHHDDGDHSHVGHEPRTSCTSPHPNPPQPAAVATARQQARTGNSQARTGNSQPRSRPSKGAVDTAGASSPASDRQTEDTSHNTAPAVGEEEQRSEDSSGGGTGVQHGVGHTGESSEAVPVSMRSSKPAAQQQQGTQHNRPTSSISEQGLNSAAGTHRSHLPGDVALPLVYHYSLALLTTSCLFSALISHIWYKLGFCMVEVR